MSFSDGPRLRVAVAVAPAMLADELRIVLENHAEITVVLAGSIERFDLAP